MLGNDQMADETLSITRRQWLRISVRGMIVLVLLIGVGLGWFIHSARTQRDAVAAIEDTGRQFGYAYDWELRDGDIIPNGKPWAPKWIVDHLGADFFGSVVRVDLGLEATNNVMGHIGRLNRLEELYLGGNQVTDSWLIHLRGLKNLRILDVGTSQITDAGLAHLERLPKLEKLELSQTKVTDAGLSYLDGLTGLKDRELVFTAVSDIGLMHLKRFKNLRRLDLRGTKVTEAAIAEIRKALPQLKVDYN
jgi:hypothetical protein